MPESGNGERDEASLKDVWQKTLTEMAALAKEYTDDGWHVVDLVAVDTAPESPSAGSTDRFGFVYTLPKDDAEAFQDVFEQETFTRYDVYRREVRGGLFFITVLLDPGTQTAIFIAGQVDLRSARGLINTAREEGVLYTYVQMLDQTLLGSFRHDDPAKFFPDLGMNSETGTHGE